ncbi:LysM domain-containing protein [Aerococcus loyolae]|nr:LysM peptidoglycan-binding domain-containing protein [Aerococcus loyolae]KAA9266266.1 LysM peptidoglycan-binding domain-containing protein [Aerococcus loyolae]PKY81994.1 LysM domain-containing protein [Aerococcus loyolae]PKZ02983.1 LysM domain-containing protein [Aerococcus loyolae]RAV67328.1 LysM domain-containing protein [Aerococcus loyolae]
MLQFSSNKGGIIMAFKDNWNQFKNKWKKEDPAVKEENSDVEEFEEKAEASSADEYENLKNRQYSRSSRNKKEKGVSPTVKVLIALGLLFILIPYAAYIIYGNQQKQPESMNVDQVMVSKSENDSQKQAEEESKKAEESKQAEESKKQEESQQAAQASQQAAQEARQAAEQSQAVQQSQQQVAAQEQSRQQASRNQNQQNTNQNQNVGSYQVSAGDNLYRIAVNHGMTLNQLLELNGLHANSPIAPGTVLRVYQ